MKFCPPVMGGTCSELVPRAARLLDSASPSLLRVQTIGSGAAPSAPSKLSHSWNLQARGAPPSPGTAPGSAAPGPASPASDASAGEAVGISDGDGPGGGAASKTAGGSEGAGIPPVPAVGGA